MISFFVAGTPVAQGNHRATRRGRIYETTKGHREWREAVRLAASAIIGDPITGPVQLTALFTFVRPMSHLKVGGGLRKGKPLGKTTKPDLSKLVRCVEDSITDAGVWRDDSQVTDLVAYKTYGKNPGVLIKIAPIVITTTD
mgnify:CR=1 FL=1